MPRTQAPAVRWRALLCVMAWLAACQPVAGPFVERAQPAAADALPGEAARSWFQLQLRLTRETPGFTPPVASRALAYAGVALYEAVAGGMPAHNSLVGQLNDLASLPARQAGAAYHWGVAANSALATSLRALYPTAPEENLAAIGHLESAFAKRFRADVRPEVFERSAAYGQAIAQAVYVWSQSDGGHNGHLTNFPKDYAPPAGPGLWAPTPPGYRSAMQPYWGENRPFVLSSGQACAPAPPVAYSAEPGSPFYAEAMDVVAAVNELTDEQRAMALFWADDPGVTFTPAGHSVSIATAVLAEQDASLAVSAETYARLTLALADAFIGCWSVKYSYSLLRPIEYIQAVIDPAWAHPGQGDPVLTPPFPEYPSGHSVQSGAAAAVLTALFGDDYAFSDNTHADLGLPPRAFRSFTAAAEEAGISRLYGGIHFPAAIREGLAQGECIGAQVNALRWRR